MKHNRLNTVLTELGLSENEAKVYLANLALGVATITQIAHAAGIKRTTVYSVIESLQLQGLVSIELKGLKNRYVAENPERLNSILIAKREMLEKALPELASLFNLHGSEGVIKYYQGLAAVKSVYESFLVTVQPGDDYLVLGNIDTWYRLDPEFFRDFMERRGRLPINIKFILEDSPFARKNQKFQRNYNSSIKLFPEGKNFKLNVVITPQKIAFHQLVPPIQSIVIENRFLIETHQMIFNLLWESLA